MILASGIKYLARGSKCPMFKNSGPKSIKGIILNPSILKCWVLGPSRLHLDHQGHVGSVWIHGDEPESFYPGE